MRCLAVQHMHGLGHQIGPNGRIEARRATGMRAALRGSGSQGPCSRLGGPSNWPFAWAPGFISLTDSEFAELRYQARKAQTLPRWQARICLFFFLRFSLLSSPVLV